MTLQHSPGPWTIANDADGWDNIVDAEGSLIAEVDSCSGGKDSDARLIAASPDMLRLLRVFAVPMTQLRRLSDGELRAALEETADLVSRLDGEA